MNIDARRKALAELAELSALAPEVRVGQLVAHLGDLSEDEGGLGLGDIEDEQLIDVIDRHRRELASLKEVSNQTVRQSGAA